MVFELNDFKQVQASVFQVTRAPGKTLVYLGCALLIVGVFAMLYIRERRLWIWLAPAAGDGTQATMAHCHVDTGKRWTSTREFETPASARSCWETRMNTATHHHRPSAPDELLPRRSPLDWLFALLVVGGGALRLRRYGAVHGRATRRGSCSARCRLRSASAGSGARCAC